MAPAQSAALVSKLATLSDNYATMLPGKLMQLEQSLHQCQSKNAAHTDFETLRLAVHTLAGSAPIFGFASLGQAAREANLHLNQYIDDTEKGQHCSFDTVVKKVDELLRWAKIDPKHPPAHSRLVSEQIISTSGTAHDEYKRIGKRSPLLYFISDESNQSLQSQLAEQGYQVQPFADLSTALAAAKQQKPEALFIDVHLTDKLTNIIALQSGVMATVPVLVLGDNGSFDHRLKAAKANAAGYFVQPVNLPELKERLDALLMHNLDNDPYRILIIDDDAETLAYYRTILTDAHMAISELNDPSGIFERLDQFKPELILIDMYMPQCTGLQLARIIRQHAIWLPLPIVFLSTEGNTEKQQFAMRVGADDFLEKSIAPTLLISTLGNRIERFRALRRLLLREQQSQG